MMSPTAAPEPFHIRYVTDRLRAAVASLTHSIDEAEEGVQPKPATDILSEAALAGATDVHLSAQEHGGIVRFRIDGSMVDVASLEPGQTARLIRQLQVIAGLDPLRAFTASHGHATLELAPGRAVGVRITHSPTAGGQIVAVRLIEPERLLRPLDQLGLRDEDVERVRDWMSASGGLLFIAGPTGSGKTTSLYAFINHLRTAEQRVLTVEDPVESEIPGVDQIQTDDSRGADMVSVINTALRLDPDVIAVGEVRDSESARAAVAACLSGHAVLTTVHAPSPAGVVTLLRHCGVNDFEIAASLGMSISQRLVRLLCERCRHERPISSAEEDWCRRQDINPPRVVWDADGCEACGGRGYRGRTGVFEIWTPTAEQLADVRDGCSEGRLAHPHVRRHDAIIHRAIDLVRDGRTSMSEVRRVCGGTASHVNIE